jgi:hypothetical protein
LGCALLPPSLNNFFPAGAQGVPAVWVGFAAESRRLKRKDLNHRDTDGFARDDFVCEADIDRLRRQNYIEKELKVDS